MKKALLTIIAIIAVLCLMTVWDNKRVSVSRYEIKSDKITESLKIAQISDFHSSELGEKVVKRVKKKEPDIIVITGDLISDDKEGVKPALDFVEELQKIAPTYFVTGNHEYYSSSYDDIKETMEEYGTEVLDEETVEINEEVNLSGINDPYFEGGLKADPVKICKELLSNMERDDSKYNILLSHRPEAFESYEGYDLVLTGHTHGGQFRIPFKGGVVAPNQGFFPKYDAGKFTKDGLTMIVSRGIGNSLIPIRINNPPDVVIVEIDKM